MWERICAVIIFVCIGVTMKASLVAWQEGKRAFLAEHIAEEMMSEHEVYLRTVFARVDPAFTCKRRLASEE